MEHERPAALERLQHPVEHGPGRPFLDAIERKGHWGRPGDGAKGVRLGQVEEEGVAFGESDEGVARRRHVRPVLTEEADRLDGEGIANPAHLAGRVCALIEAGPCSRRLQLEQRPLTDRTRGLALVGDAKRGERDGTGQGGGQGKEPHRACRARRSGRCVAQAHVSACPVTGLRCLSPSGRTGVTNLSGIPTRRPMAFDWTPQGDYTDIRYETRPGIAKVTISRPEVRNAFRPTTLFELSAAFETARNDAVVGVIILTGEGTEAFCSGGDQKIRGDAGYLDPHGTPRLNVLDLQIQMRRLPKPIIAMVAGFAIGGGHILHLVCDLTIAADNAVFGQTGPKVGSFDGGYGAGLLARMVGDKRAREIWYLCRQYSAAEAYEMGMVNTVVPLAELEAETVAWARAILEKSPLAIRMMKAAINAAGDGLSGQQQFAGDATLLFYMSEEAQEGRNAFNEKRPPDFGKFPRLP